MDCKKRIIYWNSKKVDTVAVLLFFISFVPFGILNLVDTNSPILTTGSVWYDSFIAIDIFLVGMVLHEGLHALGGILFGKLKRKEISFGLDVRSGSLYTHFHKPMKKNAYAVGLILPFIVTGILPFLLTFFMGGIILMVPCCLLLCACACDLLMFGRVCRLPKDALIIDHPKALAFFECYLDDKVPDGFVETGEEEEQKAVAVSGGLSTGKNGGKKSYLLKCLGILLFVGLYVLLMFIVAKLMEFV